MLARRYNLHTEIDSLHAKILLIQSTAMKQKKKFGVSYGLQELEDA